MGPQGASPLVLRRSQIGPHPPAIAPVNGKIISDRLVFDGVRREEP